ncbi:KTSC domain-containing protein [Angustibacter luteus]|uniref:KTSC domain-containing protein n=1 Tax=Angustibacter luteus TaxID=658456 RepID=A0ABW1JE66_9ACTN
MPRPDMISVLSSSIAAVGFDAERRELHVRFVGGATYAYLDVPAEVFQALLQSTSKGAFVNRELKPGYDVRDVGR